MFDFTKETIGSLKRNIVFALEIEIPALFLYTYVIFPICRMVLNSVMRSQGYAYFIDNNIAGGFQNIWILLTLFCIILFLGLCFYIELVILMAAMKYEHQVFGHIFPNCMRAIAKVFSPYGILLVLLSFFIGMIIHLNLLVVVLQNLGFNQIRQSILSDSGFVLPAGLVLIVVVYICLRFLFVYPLIACEGAPIKKSLSVSGRLMKKRYIKSFGGFLMINAVVFVLFALIYLFVMVVIMLAINYTHTIDMQYAVSMTVMDTANRTLIFIYTVVLVAVNMEAVMILRRRYAEGSEPVETLPTDLPKKQRKIVTHKIIFAWMLCSLIVFISVNNDFLHNFRLQTGYNPEGFRPEIIAHRGNSYAAPENTLAALRAAIEEKADSAEIDVRMTKDGELILMHDRSLLRTCGVDEDVSQLTYAEISVLDAGSWFSPEFSGERIPTLQEALELCKGELALMVEVKSDSGQDEVVRKIIDGVETMGMAQDVIVASFSLDALKEAKKLNQSIVTCLNLSVAYGNIADIPEVDMFSIELRHMQKTVVQNIKRNGKSLVVWTVNDTKNLSYVRDLGIDAVITDRLVRARVIFYEGPVPGFLYRTLISIIM